MASKGPKLDKKTAHKLLDKLSTDDVFRATFENSPQEALAELGWEADADVEQTGLVAGGGSACLTSSVTLASKETIAADRDDLVSALSMPFQFRPPAGLLK